MIKPITYYRLTRTVRHPDAMRLSTAAVLSCAICGVVIDGMGGGETVVCVDCHDLLRDGQVRSAMDERLIRG